MKLSTDLVAPITVTARATGPILLCTVCTVGTSHGTPGGPMTLHTCSWRPLWSSLPTLWPLSFFSLPPPAPWPWPHWGLDCHREEPHHGITHKSTCIIIRPRTFRPVCFVPVWYGPVRYIPVSLRPCTSSLKEPRCSKRPFPDRSSPKEGCVFKFLFPYFWGGEDQKCSTNPRVSRPFTLT
jgi:hypothetical protein